LSDKKYPVMRVPKKVEIFITNFRDKVGAKSNPEAFDILFKNIIQKQNIVISIKKKRAREW